eukprot:CAMPEP_0197458808 /NCGR_PEP_ID=MMETSP1175-20131217/49682_1 /TAXON_ID=1003142 /ORGANISM="Triceratium dubium, Strain CCMP147" /LENGTH=33 /DNA_ID= /DNA_START= /DNA_END= /DNA_ORIENTATION=
MTLSIDAYAIVDAGHSTNKASHTDNSVKYFDNS